MSNPSGFQFTAGNQVQLLGRDWIIEPYVDDLEIPLRSSEGWDRQRFERRQLLSYLSEGQLKFIDQRSEQDRQRQQAYCKAQLDLTPEQEKVIDHWLTYLNALHVEGVTQFNKSTWKRIIRKTYEDAPSSFRMPSPITLWRKQRAFIQAGRLPAALIPNVHRNGGNDLHDADIESRELLKSFVETHWLTPQQRSIAEVHELYEHEIHTVNKLRRDEPLRVLSYAAMWRHVSGLPRSLVMERRLGERAAEADFRICAHSPRTKRVLEIVEIDHTPLNAIFVDKKRGAVLGRAYLTMGICKHTRCIPGFHTSYHPPCSLTVAHMLKFAILSKDQVIAAIPEINGPYPCVGLPETLVVDNAREFYSAGFVRSCAELGIKLRYAKRKKPWWKPFIERLMKSINHQLVHTLPGTTFEHVDRRGAFDPAKAAIVDFDDFNSALLKWIVDYYHRRPHRGLDGRAPLQAWEECCREFPPSQPASREALNGSIGKHVVRTITRMGVEWEHLFFNCEALQLIRQDFPVRHDCKCDVIVDEDDLSSVVVVDPRKGETIRVPALERDYTQGLTLHQHRVNRRIVAEAGINYVDRASLVAAKHQAYEMAVRSLEDRTKTNGKQLAARYLNVSMKLSGDHRDGDSLAAMPVSSHDAESRHSAPVSTAASTQRAKRKPARCAAPVLPVPQAQVDDSDEWGVSI